MGLFTVTAYNFYLCYFSTRNINYMQSYFRPIISLHYMPFFHSKEANETRAPPPPHSCPFHFGGFHMRRLHRRKGRGVIKNPKLGAKDKQILRTEAGRGSNNQEILWMSYMEVPFKKISRRHAKFPHCLYAVLLSLSFSLSFHLNKEFRNFSPLPSSFRAPRDDRDSFK